MKKQRLLALLMALLLLSGCGAGNSAVHDLESYPDAEMQAAADASTELLQAEELDASAGILVTEVLDEYINGEVFVSYSDGSFEVLAFETEDELATGLKALEQDETVTLLQPNYSYINSALSTDDALAAQQWALSNDGSFQMEEQKNRYPVYDSPFGAPSAPGQWTMPGNFGQPGGPGGFFRGQAFYRSMSTQQTNAVSGIDINAEEAWALYNSGTRDVVVALIDTGVDYTHEDITDAIWINEDEIANNGVDDDGNGYIDDVYGWNFYSNNNRVYVGDEDDHGTHGAGTIAADANNGIGIAGIVDSNSVKIMSLKALGGRDGSGTTASIIQAIRYAEANGASICNLSLGSSTNDRALYQAIAKSSMLFVVAAGNDGTDTDASPCYPASYSLENIISVANLNYDGSLHYSSNYGASSVDLAAPGSYILSTTPGDGYSYMTGSSMSAPMVSGAAAMVYSHYEDITLADVKEILLDSARKLEALGGSSMTGGMLDLGAAMAYDVNSLSGIGWDPEDVDNGSAPEISVEQSVQQGRTILTVQITDSDNDLTTAVYAGGTLDAGQFQGGRIGKSFSLDKNGRVAFTVSASGTFTFYACDSMGNETVKTVTVECEAPQASGYPQNGGGTRPGGASPGMPVGFPAGGWKRGR